MGSDGRHSRMKLVEYDALRRRLWIRGQRCHHGATGSVVAGLACLGLISDPARQLARARSISGTRGRRRADDPRLEGPLPLVRAGLRLAAVGRRPAGAIGRRPRATGNIVPFAARFPPRPRFFPPRGNKVGFDEFGAPRRTFFPLLGRAICRGDRPPHHLPLRLPGPAVQAPGRAPQVEVLCFGARRALRATVVPRPRRPARGRPLPGPPPQRHPGGPRHRAPLRHGHRALRRRRAAPRRLRRRPAPPPPLHPLGLGLGPAALRRPRARPPRHAPHLPPGRRRRRLRRARPPLRRADPGARR